MPDSARSLTIGYHASHEQLPPSALLEAVIEAERAGFDAAMASDHLAPWGVRQGESGSTLAWMGAALASTSFPIGAVATPGQRYHPVVMAHAMATYAEMFPGRYWAALGSGELLNEHVTGDPWPSKDERTARLGESVEVIRALHRGETVDHDGLVRAHRARLWSLPAEPPALLATATSPETAAWAAEWAEGLLTVGAQPDEVRPLARAYREAGGRGILALQVHIALADDDAAARAVIRDQWRHEMLDPPALWDIEQPEDFDERAQEPDDAVLGESVIAATDVDELADRLAALVACGFDAIYLHEVSKDQTAFLARARTELLPALRARIPNESEHTA